MTNKYMVHESSYVDDDVEIGEGTKIWHFSHVQKGARIGKNCSLGQNVNIGKSNNQNFVQIPLYDLRQQLHNLCERYNMNYIETEENYTSKSSFLDLDILHKLLVYCLHTKYYLQNFLLLLLFL